MAENQTIEELRAPLLAALGAADLALATVTDLVTNMRERAEEARGDATNRVEESRARLANLREDLPEQFAELREKFTGDELRKAAEGYLEAATSRYNDLVERGEAALERLRSQSGFEDASARAEDYVDQAVELTQEALGNVASPSVSGPPSWSVSSCPRRTPPATRARRPRQRTPPRRLRRRRPPRRSLRPRPPRRPRPRRSPRSRSCSTFGTIPT